MMSKFNSLFVWSAKGTRGQQSRPAFVQGINNVPNVLMSFGGWNAFRRMHRQTRSLLAVLLIGMFGLVLAGCGDDDPTTITRPDPGEMPGSAFATLPVSDLQAVRSGNDVEVSWTNPDRDSITGFNVSWVDVNDDTDDGLTMELDSDSANVAELEDNTHTISDLNFGATYDITVTVLYRDGRSEMSDPKQVIIPPDSDNDGFADPDDADYDNDSLIEIRNLDDLALLRDDLDGDGVDDEGVKSMGCPEGGCIGYELTRSLDFSDPNSYADAIAGSDNMVAWTSGNGWEPITHCIIFDCDPYTGIFEGNNFNISNLFIGGTSSTEIGLFAIFNGSIRNLNLLDANVTAAGGDAIGLLVGKGLNGGRYDNLSVSGTLTAVKSEYVGGLIGQSDDSKINRVYMASGSVSGDRRVGGLVGWSRDATSIRHSYVSDVTVKGDRGIVGGLVGSAENTDILYSYASNVSVFGDFDVGGLAGTGTGTNIFYSYAVDGNVSAMDDSIGRAGGLVGDAFFDNPGVNISYSYAAVRNITGGLAGRFSGFSHDIIDSYWDVNMTSLSAGENSKTTLQLKGAVHFDSGIYQNWDGLVCDPDTGDVMESSDGSIPADSRFTRHVWDLGTDEEYPALNCVPGGLEAQRTP